MAVIRCPHCKLPYTEDEARSGLCPGCGGAFQETASQPSAAQAPTAPRWNRSGSVWWIGGALGAFLVAATVVFVLRQGTEDENGPTPPPVAASEIAPKQIAQVPKAKEATPPKADEQPQPAAGKETPAKVQKPLDPAAQKNRAPEHEPGDNPGVQVAAAPEELPAPRAVPLAKNGRQPAKELAKAKKNAGFRFPDFPGNPNDDPVEELAKALEELRKLQAENLMKMQKLGLGRGGVGGLGMPGLALNPLLARELKQMRDLQQLNKAPFDRLPFDRIPANRLKLQPEHDMSGKPIQGPELQNLRGVTSLNLSDTPIDDKGIAFLKGQTQLRSLKLKNTFVSGAGLEQLKGLQRLDLAGTPITDEGLKHVEGLADLRELSLAGTRITGTGLAKLKGLQILDLSDTPIDDKGIAFLKDHKTLRSLNLKNTFAAGAGLDQLKGLQRLDVTGAPISDEGLKHLEKLPQLRELYLGPAHKISPEAMRKLQGKLPRLRIVEGI